MKVEHKIIGVGVTVAVLALGIGILGVLNDVPVGISAAGGFIVGSIGYAIMLKISAGSP